MKRTKVLTRKQRAIRRTLWALVTLLAVNHFLGVGLLLPIQGIRQTEEHEGVYPHGTVVARRWDPDLRWNKVVYLTANENAVSLGDASLELFGWFPGFGCAVDCTGDEPLYVGERTLSRDGRHLTYCFGRVDDPDIVTVAVSVQLESYVNGEAVREEVYRLTAGEDALIVHQGRRYFLLRDDWASWPYEPEWPNWEIIGCDRDGNEVCRWDIDQWSHSSY